VHENIENELRNWAQNINDIQGIAALLALSGAILTEAADEIERLKKENKNITEQMDEQVDITEYLDSLANDLYHALVCTNPQCPRREFAIEEWESRNLPEESPDLKNDHHQ
jgi:hypothetical protein